MSTAVYRIWVVSPIGGGGGSGVERPPIECVGVKLWRRALNVISFVAALSKAIFKLQSMARSIFAHWLTPISDRGWNVSLSGGVSENILARVLNSGQSSYTELSGKGKFCAKSVDVLSFPLFSLNSSTLDSPRIAFKMEQKLFRMNLELIAAKGISFFEVNAVKSVFKMYFMIYARNRIHFGL